MLVAPPPEAGEVGERVDGSVDDGAPAQVSG